MDNILKIRVYDKGDLSDDTLGECETNLNMHNMLGDAESKVASGCLRNTRGSAVGVITTSAQLIFEHVNPGTRGI